MTLLAELFELLEKEPEKSGKFHERTEILIASANAVKVALPAINGHRPAAEPRQAATIAPPVPTPAPSAKGAPVRPQSATAQNVARTEGSPAARRNAWTITRGGRPICTICGSPMTYAEALAEAHWRWLDAAIE